MSSKTMDSVGWHNIYTEERLKVRTLTAENAKLREALESTLAAYESLLPEDVNPGANNISTTARAALDSTK